MKLQDIALPIAIGATVGTLLGLGCYKVITRNSWQQRMKIDTGSFTIYIHKGEVMVILHNYNNHEKDTVTKELLETKVNEFLSQGMKKKEMLVELEKYFKSKSMEFRLR